jgi:hypothetical protein
VYLGVAASKGSSQIWTVLASRRHPVLLPCQHWALGHCCPAAVSLLLLHYCGLRLELLFCTSAAEFTLALQFKYYSSLGQSSEDGMRMMLVLSK